MNKSELETLSVGDIEKKLLSDPMIKFLLKENEIDTASNSVLNLLAEKILSDTQLEQFKDDYKDRLLILAQKASVNFSKGTSHGLFGKVENKYGDIYDLEKTMHYIDDKTKNGTIMYQSLISFSPEDAQELGFDNDGAFKKMLRENILKIADRIGIPPSRLEYVGAVHLKKSNPHVHFMFWDKEQGVKEAFVPKEVSSNIRDDLIKSVYKDYLSELYKIKNEAREILTKGISSQYKDMADYYTNLSEKEYFKERKNKLALFGSLLDNKFKPSFIKQFGKEYMNIIKRLPKKGSLKFQYLELSLKERITKTIKNLINENEDFNREYNRFVNSAVDIAKFYSNNPERHAEAKKNAEDDIIKRMANQMLAAMKDVKKYDSVVTKDYSYKKRLTVDITTSIFQILSQNSNEAQRHYNDLKQELSKQAKKELVKKLESASDMDWERD